MHRYAIFLLDATVWCNDQSYVENIVDKASDLCHGDSRFMLAWLQPQMHAKVSVETLIRRKRWLEDLGVAADDYSTHSLRKTKASAIYENTKNVEAIRQLLGHSSVSATSHYLGIEKAQALDIAREHKMF